MSAYLVTGGAGFIGSHLCDALLAAGHRVRVLDDFSTGRVANLDPRCDMLRGDVADPRTVARAIAGADGCFHLAAIASVQRCNEAWGETHRVNQGGTVCVLDAARAAGRVPVVYASSAAVYGDLGHAVAREDLRPVPLTAYGADKLGSELHASVAHRVHGVATLGLRFFNVYGLRQDPASPYSGVISIFARRLAEGLPITVHGDGTQTRDFVHVSDVVAHLCAAMAHLTRQSGAEVVNVCTGQAVSIRDLAQTLATALGRPLRLQSGPARAGDIRRSLGDPTRALGILGVAARMPLAAGLRTLAPAAGVPKATADALG